MLPTPPKRREFHLSPALDKKEGEMNQRRRGARRVFNLRANTERNGEMGAGVGVRTGPGRARTKFLS